MSTYSILAWQPLLRPPLPDQEPPAVPHVPLKALACRNSIASMAALIISSEPARAARAVIDDLVCGENVIPASAVSIRLVGVTQSTEVGGVCDPLFEVDTFDIDKSAALYISVTVPKTTPAGIYRGRISLMVNGENVACNDMEVEIANVVLPDVYDWDFFLNVWMNPASVARVHGVELWSDAHFEALKPYVEDLAAHGQKTVVAPICYKPWGGRTRDSYPNIIRWTKRGEGYEFDFSAFDRYVTLHEQCGIDRAIHCYSIVNGRDDADTSVIEFFDTETGKMQLLETHVGDEEYVRAWGAFLDKFSEHLCEMGWMDKTHIAFANKPAAVMQKMAEFLSKHGSGFRAAVASRDSGETYESVEDLAIEVEFDDRGVADTAPLARSVMDVADLLDPERIYASDNDLLDKTSTTFYVCSAPQHPNTFVHSPLVESRALPFLVLQGGFDGFVRWAYNDWSDDPFGSPGWDNWPTGDTFLVYPGESGPISSLRWEQLREGIQDYELAILASESIRTPDEMVDYEQAVSLACRDLDGRTKSTGDIEIARRLLIPIAEREE